MIIISVLLALVAFLLFIILLATTMPEKAKSQYFAMPKWKRFIWFLVLWALYVFILRGITIIFFAWFTYLAYFR